MALELLSESCALTLCSYVMFCILACEFVIEKWCLGMIHKKNDGCGLVHEFCVFVFVLFAIMKLLCAVSLEHLLHELGCRINAYPIHISTGKCKHCCVSSVSCEDGV